MKAHILVVEGNAAADTAKMVRLGGRAYAESYARLLESLAPGVSCSIVHPAENGPDCLPAGKALSDFDGIAWTGSALSCYMDLPEVNNQLRLAEKAFASGTPVFGSCWGLQVMAVALGGGVRKNPKGREIYVGKKITLTKAGVDHPMYEGKGACFDALSVHGDEVETLPAGTVVLAGNGMSHVQAAAIEEGGNSFWGVQYHPEFDFGTMAIVLRRLAAQLVEEGIFDNRPQVEARAENLRRIESDPQCAPRGSELSPSISESAVRRRELSNWLRVKVLARTYSK